MNIWQEFAALNGMTPEDFSKEVIKCAQACLSIDLEQANSEKVELVSNQYDGVYRLTYERIDK